MVHPFVHKAAEKVNCLRYPIKSQMLILWTKTMACTPSQMLVKVGCNTIRFRTILERV